MTTSQVLATSKYAPVPKHSLSTTGVYNAELHMLKRHI